MDLENTLNEIGSLVTRSEKGAFLEEELQPLVFGIIENNVAIPAESQERFKELFVRIAAMDKSTYFGCWFYRYLHVSDLPLRQEIFEKAVYSEPYYNCRGDALAGYLITVLRNNGFNNDELLDYLSNRDTRDSLPRPVLEPKNIKTADFENVQKAIIFGLSHRGEPSMLYAALKGAFVFRSTNIIGAMEEELKQRILGLEGHATESEHHYPDTENSICSDISYTLFKLTGRENYKRITELLDAETQVIRGARVDGEKNYLEGYKSLISQILKLL